MKKSELKSYIKEQITETLSEDTAADQAAASAKKTAIDKQIVALQKKKSEMAKGPVSPLDENEGDILKKLYNSFYQGWIHGRDGDDLGLSWKRWKKGQNLNKNDNSNLNENNNLSEGTWGLGSKEQISQFINNIKQIKDKYYDIVGDDLLYDKLDGAIKRAEELLPYSQNDKINEMARKAVLVKIGNKKKAEQLKEKAKLPWVKKMIDNVIAAGKNGISQPALASSIDKQQQGINSIIKQLIDAGVFAIVGAPTDKKKENKPKSEPKQSEKPKSNPKDEEDEEVEDNWNKPDEEDKGENEDDVEKQALSGAKKVNNKASRLDNVLRDLKKLDSEMKSIAKQYKEAPESEKSKYVDQLKEKTKLKKELEGLKEKYANELV